MPYISGVIENDKIYDEENRFSLIIYPTKTKFLNKQCLYHE